MKLKISISLSALWRCFETRAKRWEQDQGELGEIVAKELRTINDAWRDATCGSTIQDEGGDDTKNARQSTNEESR